MIDLFRPHHVGWAVADIAAAERAFLGTGYSPDPSLPGVTDSSFGVRLRFIRPTKRAGAGEAGPLIELIAPAGGASAVSRILERSGPGPYHLGYCVDDLASAAGELRQRGFRPVAPPQAAPAFGGREVQFLHHQALGLIELIAWPQGS